MRVMAQGWRYLLVIVAVAGLAACAGVSLDGPPPRPAESVAAMAEAGDADAQVALGMMYEAGDGVPRDLDLAAGLYRLAAEQGNALGEYALAELYARGRGVPRDDARAVRWFRAAAEQGEPAAQFRLGYYYEHGLGVARDYAKAARWYARARDGWRNLGRVPPGVERLLQVPSEVRLRPPGAAAGPAPAPAEETAPKAPSPAAQATAAAKAAGVLPETTEPAAATTEPAAETTEPAVEPAPVALTPAPAETQPGEAAPSPAETTPAETTPAETTPAETTPSPTETAATAKSPAETAPRVKAPADSRGRLGGLWVHVASFRTPRAALRFAARIEAEDADLIGALQVGLARVNLGETLGEWVRVRVGPLAGRAAAKALCRRFKARDLYCAPLVN